MDNLEAQTYETFERDSIKYIQVCCVCLFYFLHILNFNTSTLWTTLLLFSLRLAEGSRPMDDFVIHLNIIWISCVVASYVTPNFCLFLLPVSKSSCQSLGGQGPWWKSVWVNYCTLHVNVLLSSYLTCGIFIYKCLFLIPYKVLQ